MAKRVWFAEQRALLLVYVMRHYVYYSGHVASESLIFNVGQILFLDQNVKSVLGLFTPLLNKYV